MGLGLSETVDPHNFHFFFESSQQIHVLLACLQCFTWIRSSFVDKRSRTCHVASPLMMGLEKSTARRFSSFQRFLCIKVRFVAATCWRILSNLGKSSSRTVNEISLHGITCEYGNEILSAIITGTQPYTTASTIRGLHGAHPKGHKQNTDRRSSSW